MVEDTIEHLTTRLTALEYRFNMRVQDMFRRVETIEKMQKDIEYRLDSLAIKMKKIEKQKRELVELINSNRWKDGNSIYK